MQKLTKAQHQVPRVLFSEEVRRARQEIEGVLLLSEAKRQQRRVHVEEAVFSDPELQQVLLQSSRGKCSYCETDLRTYDEIVVHHFRPYRNATNKLTEKGDLHHYAWFAYDWNNLQISCSTRARAAGTLFPVIGPRAPFFSSLDEARELENSRLIDPYFDDPDHHLRFQWNGLCSGKNDRGWTTVSVFDLNRHSLVSSRSGEFKQLLLSIQEFSSRGTDRRIPLYRALDSDSQHLGAKKSLLADFVGRLREEGNVSRRYDKINSVDSFGLIMEDAGDDAIAMTVKGCLDESELKGVVEPTPPAHMLRPRYPAADGMAYDSIERTASSLVQISSISIHAFKGIGHLKISLPARRNKQSTAPCLMIIGENSTGKSSILEAVALACSGPQAAQELVSQPSELLQRKEPSRWGLINAEATIVEIQYYGDQDFSRIIVDQLGVKFSGEVGSAPIILGYGPRRFFSKSKTVKRKSPAARIRSLFDPLSTIPYPVDWLRTVKEPTFSAVVRALREVLALHHDDDVIRDSRIGVSVRVNGRITPLDRMSEGYRSLFAMVVDIARELIRVWPSLEVARAIVLIDEIETHLHPRWKMKVVSALRRAFPNVSFIATTHDPLCLRGMDDGEVIVLNKDREQNVELVTDLPSIKGLRADQLLTSEYFGLSSTIEPEIEQKIVSYVDSLSEQDKESWDETTRLRTELESLTFSSSATEQLIEAAMKKFIEARRGASVAERTEARDKAVKSVLEGLRLGFDKDDSRR